MKLFKRKKKERGSYRTAADKLKEERAKIDITLARAFQEDLRTHPSFTREIARRKFGLAGLEQDNDHYDATPVQPDIMELIQQFREIKTAFQEEFPEKSGSWLQEIAAIAPAIIGALKEMRPQQSPQQPEYYPAPSQRLTSTQPKRIERTQEPPPEPPQSTPEQPEQPGTPQQTELDTTVYQPDIEEASLDEVKNFVENILALTPEEATAELYLGSNIEGDFRATIWQYLSENDIDSLWKQLPLLESLPEVEKFSPIIAKLTNDKTKIWLSLVIDEINLVNSGEKTIEISENQPGNDVNNA